MEGILFGILAFAAGGVLKGATGAGAPVLVVPVLVVFYDVPTAVALFTVPNLMSNLWQGWTYRLSRLPTRFVTLFALSGAAGAMIGTYMLASLSPDLLQIIVALVVLVYIGFRLRHPHWTLAYAAAARIVAPVGLVAGVMQGASGISAPVSIGFLSAMRLERPQFIATITVLFFAMAVVQIPLLSLYGIMTVERALFSTAAILPLLAGMPMGAWLARRVSRAAFDRLILALLAIIAVKLMWDVLG